MRRLALVGLLLALPFVAVPLVWAAANGESRPSVCTAVERGDRASMTEGEPSVRPVRWDAHPRAVPADRLAHNLRHGGVAVRYGAQVPDAVVERVVAWYRRDPVAVVVAPQPELGARLVLSSWSGSARCRGFDESAFTEFRTDRRFQGPESPPRAQLRPARPVEQLRARSTRIAFVVTEEAGVTVEVRDAEGRIVRSLGHFTVPGRQQLILEWDGNSLPAGRYSVIVTAVAERGTDTTLAHLLRR